MLTQLPLFFLTTEVAVVAFVNRQFLVFDVSDGVGDGIQKIAVVGNQQYRSFVVFQKAFQPFGRSDIQVVRGFVKNQQIGAGEDDLSECQPCLLAAGAGADPFAVVRF